MWLRRRDPWGREAFVSLQPHWLMDELERRDQVIGRVLLRSHGRETAVGGFLRGQALMGIVYFGVALFANLLMGLPLAALTSTASGILQAIPFFGPFLSWAPPVIVALLFKPEALVPTTIIMVVGWFLVMNVLQPRIMQGAVGIHPIVVLGSVLIGSRIAGIPGAIFGIPFAAVLSSFFFFYLHRSSGDRTVADRAAKRVSEREGRVVKPPREPAPGQAADVEST